jgi:hypothetical protein
MVCTLFQFSCLNENKFITDRGRVDPDLNAASGKDKFRSPSVKSSSSFSHLTRINDTNFSETHKHCGWSCTFENPFLYSFTWHIIIAQVNGHNVNKRLAEIKFHVTERKNICKMCQLARPLFRLYSSSVMDRTTATICKPYYLFPPSQCLPHYFNNFSFCCVGGVACTNKTNENTCRINRTFHALIHGRQQPVSQPMER